MTVMNQDNPNDPLSRIKQQRQDTALRDAENARTQSVIDAFQNGNQEISETMRNILMATIIGKDPKLAEVAYKLDELLKNIGDAGDKFKETGLEAIPEVFSSLLEEIQQLPDKVAQTDKSRDLIPYMQEITQAVRSKRLETTVNVPETDFDPVVKAIKGQKLPKNDPLSFYKAQDINNNDPNLQYVGFVNPEGGWYIIENSGDAIRYVFGKTGYAQAFKDATKLNYRLYSEAIREA